MRLGFDSEPTLVSALGICDRAADRALVCHAAGPRHRLHGGTYSEPGCGSLDQLSVHAVFGLGLYLGAVAASLVGAA